VNASVAECAVRTVSTALGDGEPADRFTERCARLGSYGIDHVVVIARGRPLAVGDLRVLAGAVAL